MEQKLERGLELIKQIRDEAYVTDIEWELTSLEKYYKIQLYALRKQK